MVLVISIEGNIGSGKSTFLNALRCRIAERGKIKFVDEPLGIWQTVKDKDGKDIIAKFYEDKQKYSFAFQMLAFVSRLASLQSAIEEAAEGDIIICERSLKCDRMVFAAMLHDEMHMNDIEYSIYTEWFDHFESRLNARVIHTYIRTSPEVCFKRVSSRARAGEDIEVTYLEKCHDYHEKWLSSGAHLIFDGDEDHCVDNPSAYSVWISSILDLACRSQQADDEYGPSKCT